MTLHSKQLGFYYGARQPVCKSCKDFFIHHTRHQTLEFYATTYKTAVLRPREQAIQIRLRACMKAGMRAQLVSNGRGNRRNHRSGKLEADEYLDGAEDDSASVSMLSEDMEDCESTDSGPSAPSELDVSLEGAEDVHAPSPVATLASRNLFSLGMSAEELTKLASPQPAVPSATATTPAAAPKRRLYVKETSSPKAPASATGGKSPRASTTPRARKPTLQRSDSVVSEASVGLDCLAQAAAMFAEY